MKKRTYIIVIILFSLLPTLISNTSIISAQTYDNTQATYTLTSNGTIQNSSTNNTTKATALILQIKNGYYEVINAATQKSIIGGANNLTGIDGASFSAVAQAAEDYLQNGGSLEIAAGNYVSDGTVSIKGNTTIFGRGDATFIQQQAGIATHTSMFAISQTSNVEIYKMWLDGNRANQNDTGDEMRHGLVTYIAQNVLIHDMKITNFTETGWDSAWCNNCEITNCVLTGSGDGDIWVDIDSTNQLVHNNTCNQILAVDFGGTMKNIRISNNTVNFIEVFQGNTGAPSDITLNNNIIIPNQFFAIYTQGCLNLTIEENKIFGNKGITETGLLISNGKNFTISDNIVTNCLNGIKSVTNSSPTHHVITMNDFSKNQYPIVDNTTQTMDQVKYNLGVDISSWSEIP